MMSIAQCLGTPRNANESQPAGLLVAHRAEYGLYLPIQEIDLLSVNDLGHDGRKFSSLDRFCCHETSPVECLRVA